MRVGGPGAGVEAWGIGMTVWVLNGVRSKRVRLGYGDEGMGSGVRLRVLG